MGVFNDLADPLDFSGKGAADQAAQLQIDAARVGREETTRQFDLQQERLTPFLEQAAPAVDLLAKFSGSQGTGEQSKAFRGFDESAGQKFLRSRGRSAVNDLLSKLGIDQDANVSRALDKEGRGIASQSFQDQLNLLARVGGVAQTTGSQLNQGSQSFATSFGQLRQSEADATRRGSEIQQSINSNLINQGAQAFGAFAKNRSGGTGGLEGAGSDLDQIMKDKGLF